MTLSSSAVSATTDHKNYPYESVEGDPLKTRIYTLDNGLKVYLTVERNEPRVQTFIAVKAGSKMDPPETTGLAHYLEHMLFKGTHSIGTMDWEKEKEILQQISDLYEAHRNTNDEEKKKALYKEIDQLSLEASKYAIPNEYDKMISSLGAKGTNAYTSNEKTVYINDIPANELERWMKVETNRFDELVLRLFHTELETVYEEFNRGEDNDFRKSWQALYRGLFKNHTYGTQTTIGKGEHLKNPSMVNIHKYFDTYYVPNNMAVCLSGDLDFDSTIALVDQYFGQWESKPVPEFTYAPETPMIDPAEEVNFGMEGEHVYVAFRQNGAGSKEDMMMHLVNSMLSNGQAGLFDLDILQKQKVLDLASYPITMKDYSMHVLFAIPREGQSLEEAKELMLAQIERLKAGDFEDWLMDAVVKDLRYNQLKQFESNKNRAHFLVDAFVLGVDYESHINTLDQMALVTKEELVAFVNENYANNYVVAYKRHGHDESTHKVEKPEITPVHINRDVKSAFFEEFSAMPSANLEPLFLDYDRDIQRSEVSSKVPIAYIKNESNSTFGLHYILDMGKDHDRLLPLAIRYLPYLGTAKYSPSEFQKELFKHGLSLNVNTGRERVYMSLTGLDESFADGVRLFEDLLTNVVGDEKAYQDLVDGMMKSRADRKLSKNEILNKAMMSYGKFGPNSPYTDVFTEEELRAIKVDELVEKIKTLTAFPHQIFYFGSQELGEVSKVLEEVHQVPSSFEVYPAIKEYEESALDKKQVYYVHYDQKQVELMFLAGDVQFDKSLIAPSYIFNEYFGAGLSSIVFQEIREAKALAYAAYTYFSRPRHQKNKHYVRAYVGTQTDKLHEAVSAMLALMNDLPEVTNQFESAKQAALKKIESERITKSRIYWNFLASKDLGIDDDYREEVYEEIKNMDFADLKGFFDEHIKGKTFTYLVIGDREQMDFEELKKLGDFQELTEQDLFTNW